MTLLGERAVSWIDTLWLEWKAKQQIAVVHAPTAQTLKTNRQLAKTLTYAQMYSASDAVLARQCYGRMTRSPVFPKYKKGDRVALTDSFRYHRRKPVAPKGTRGTVVSAGGNGVYVLLDIDHPWCLVGKKIPKGRMRKLNDLEILAEEGQRLGLGEEGA